jgi:HlyD family secretion protein
VSGEIGFISTIAGEKGYLAKVNLTNGFTTSNNKQIQYREGLTANAEIITKDMRLLERFYIDIYRTVGR